MKFDAVKHGPAVWALMGVKWRDVELGNARVFQGWDAARLAKSLGLDLADVEAAIQGAVLGTASAAPVPTPAPAAPGVQVGGLYLARRVLTAHAFPAGGFTLDRGEAGGPGRRSLIGPADAAQVLTVAGGVVVAVVSFGSGTEGNVVLRCPVTAWGGVFRAV